MDDPITLSAAAKLLGVSPSNLQKQARPTRDGRPRPPRLKTSWIGPIRVVTLAEVERYRVESRGRFGPKRKLQATDTVEE